jgi:hypothetical protein
MMHLLFRAEILHQNRLEPKLYFPHFCVLRSNAMPFFLALPGV